MRYRQLGASGLMLSTVGFGASALGGVFGSVDQAAATRAVRTALDLGVTFFDTAPFYGDTRSELALGRALAGIARDRYVLATKVGRYGAAEFDFSAARIAASVDQSLVRLGVDHLDLVQCHDIEFVPLERIWSEALPALERLRAQGKVRAIGITGLPLAAFRTVLAHARVDCVLSYCHYTLADTTLADELPWLRAQGAGVINASPLAMGLLTDAGGPAWHPAPPAITEACARAAAHCRARGAELAKLALQFSCALDGVASTLVGIRSADELERDLRWLDEPLDPVLLAEVQAILAPVKDRTWPSGSLPAAVRSPASDVGGRTADGNPPRFSR